MIRRALFPGSFDPITLGHIDIVERATAQFDEVIVGLGRNTVKESFISLEERLHWVEISCAHLTGVRVEAYDGLTVDFAAEIGAKALVRGLRAAPDFEYEKNIAQLNFRLAGLETVFLISNPTLAPVSSTIVRDIIKYGGKVEGLVPEVIRDLLLAQGRVSG